MFDIGYYEGKSGGKPVEKLIDSLGNRIEAKAFGRSELLERYGSQLGMPFSRFLGDGIFELRVGQGNDNARILYFFVVGKRVILTHGFVKKTRKTPRRETDRAKSMCDDWRARRG